MPIEEGNVIVWHSDVHRKVFDERLCFFLLTTSTAKAESSIRDEISRLAVKHLGHTLERGVCLYYLLGSYDYLIRLWIPGKARLEEFLQEVRSLPSVYTFLPMTIGKESISWEVELKKRGVPPLSAIELEDLVTHDIQTIQEGDSSSPIRSKIEGFSKKGIVADHARLNGADHAKVFIAVHSTQIAENQEHQELILESIEEFVINPCRCLGFSTYKGDGFAKILLKFTLPLTKFREFGRGLVEVDKIGAARGYKTNTFFCLSAPSVEGSFVSQISIDSYTLKNDGLDNFLVRKYAPVLHANAADLDPRIERLDVVNFLKQHMDQLNLGKKVDESIQDFFFVLLDRSSAGESENSDESVQSQCASVFFVPIARLEQGLRGKVNSLIPAVLGGEFRNFIAKVFKGDEAKNPKMLTLGDLIKISEKFFKHHEIASFVDSDELSSSRCDVNKAVAFRNNLMHGVHEHLFTPSSWEDDLLEFINLIIYGRCIFRAYEKVSDRLTA